MLFQISICGDVPTGKLVPDWPEVIDTPLGSPDSLLLYKFQLVVLLHCTTKYVIPRRGEAPTWESPGTMFVLRHFSID